MEIMIVILVIVAIYVLRPATLPAVFMRSSVSTATQPSSAATASTVTARPRRDAGRQGWGGGGSALASCSMSWVRSTASVAPGSQMKDCPPCMWRRPSQTPLTRSSTRTCTRPASSTPRRRCSAASAGSVSTASAWTARPSVQGQ